MSDHTPLSLATRVAIGAPGSWGDGCAAWVDSRDAQCGKPRAEGYLCTRHHTVAVRRMKGQKKARVEEVEKREQQRQERLEKHGDRWRAQLARVEAELERRTGVLTTDRAAYGGVGATSVAKHNMKQFSDSNVKRVGELIRQRDDLRRKLGIKETP